MKKSTAIGIIAAVAIAAVAALYISQTRESTPVPALQNSTSTALQGNASIIAPPVHNATGRHLSVTIQEQVGIKSK